MPNYGMRRKSTPDLYTPPVVDNPDMKKSKHVGYCVKCDMMICNLDKTDAGFRCPRCKAKMEKPNSKRMEPSHSWN